MEAVPVYVIAMDTKIRLYSMFTLYLQLTFGLLNVTYLYL